MTRVVLPPVPNVTTSNQLRCPYQNETFTPILWQFTFATAFPEVLTIELLIYLTALVWNLYIILFLIIRSKNLREPPNIFLFTIGLIDLAATLITAPFYISTVIRGEWFFGTTDCERQSSCKAVGFFLSLLLLAQVNVLAAMAIDRFLAIAKPLRYKVLMTAKRAVIISISAFSAAVIPSMTPLFGFGVFFFEARLGACLFRWTGQSTYVVFFVVLLLIPITMITVFTLITYWKIRSFLKDRFHHHTRRYTVRSELPQQERQYSARQRNLLWLFTTLLMILGICWFPGISTALISAIIGTEKIPGGLFLTCLMFVLLNIAANPITHAIFIKEIRSPLVKLVMLVFCCRRSKREEQSSNVTRMTTPTRFIPRGQADGASVIGENGKISPLTESQKVTVIQSDQFSDVTEELNHTETTLPPDIVIETAVVSFEDKEVKIMQECSVNVNEGFDDKSNIQNEV